MQRISETIRQADKVEPPRVNELIGPPLGDGHGRYFVTHVIKDESGCRLLRVIDRTSTEPSHSPLRAYVFETPSSDDSEWERILGLAAKARHERLVPIVDWCLAEHRATVILDGDKAVPLFDWIEEKGEFTEQRAVEFAIGLCEAAHQVHMQGVTGLRLAPGAVFMNPDGSGPLAKAFSQFLAPIDQRPVSADIEEIALTLTHLLGCTTADAIRDRTLRQIVMRAAGLTRAHYQSADAFAIDLRRFIGQYPIDWTSLSAARDLALWSKRSPLTASLLAATFALVLISTAVISFGVTQARTRDTLQAAYEADRKRYEGGAYAINRWFSTRRAKDSESAFDALALDFMSNALQSGKMVLDPDEWLGDEGADVDLLVRLTAAMTVLSRDVPEVYSPEARAAMREEVRTALDAGALEDLESRLRATLQTADANVNAEHAGE